MRFAAASLTVRVTKDTKPGTVLRTAAVIGHKDGENMFYSIAEVKVAS